MKLKTLKYATIVAFALPFAAMAAGNVSSSGTQSSNSSATIDYLNAQAMPLPTISGNGTLTPANTGESTEGASASTSGGNGNGKESSETLIDSNDLKNLPSDPSGGITPQEFGTSNHPFSTTRVDFQPKKLSKKKPYRQSGKLFFNIGASTFVCSASMIEKGVAVTAAHCVADFGTSTFHSNWQYIPAYKDGATPFGTWTVTEAFAPTAYLNGSDPCAAGASGVVCESDVAVLVLAPDGNGKYAGNKTGWYGYGINGYGFTGVGLADGNLALITQLGYPVSHDSGQKMQRTDSQAFTDFGLAQNSVMGSRQTGGSSGGAWLVNFGKESSLSGGVSVGSEADFNIVVGVTSWGYTNQAIKQQGASPFTTGNIEALVNAACTTYPDRC